jgi:hypothetical protein
MATCRNCKKAEPHAQRTSFSLYCPIVKQSFRAISPGSTTAMREFDTACEKRAENCSSFVRDV